MRSVWKGSFVQPTIYKMLNNNNNSDKKLKTLVCNRNTTILSVFIGKTLSIYNGKKYMPLPVKSNMVGFKAGSFVFTKRTGTRIHVNKTKKRK